jgi:hypothetical protein
MDPCTLQVGGLSAIQLKLVPLRSVIRSAVQVGGPLVLPPKGGLVLPPIGRVLVVPP